MVGYNNQKQRAYVLMVGGRFYCRHSRGRVYTAWSLAGAMLFGSTSSDQFLAVTKMLERRKKKFQLVPVFAAYEESPLSAKLRDPIVAAGENLFVWLTVTNELKLDQLLVPGEYTEAKSGRKIRLLKPHVIRGFLEVKRFEGGFYKIKTRILSVEE